MDDKYGLESFNRMSYARLEFPFSFGVSFIVATKHREGDMGRVEGKVAVVAGAGGGIGGAGALGLGREGAAVVCADIDAAAAEAAAAQIRIADGRAAALGLDVRDRSAVDAVVASTIREFGRLDVLLNCVG